MSFRVGNRSWWVLESQSCSRKSTFFEESRHIHSFSSPEIDMTSILGSFPASFLEAHQSGSQLGLQLLPYRLNFRCHFQKSWWFYWCLLCFNNWCGKKVQINLPKRVSRGCNESRLDATIVDLTSKSLNIHSYAGLLKWSIIDPLSERENTAIFENMPWEPPSSSGSDCSTQYSDFFLFLFLRTPHLHLTLVLTDWRHDWKTECEQSMMKRRTENRQQAGRLK